MKNFYTRMVAVAMLGFSLYGWAQTGEIQLRDDHPDEYIVVKGDTLWDISESFLANPWMWPEIWHANPQIDNPHLIFPGDVISLIYLDGQPRLTVNRRGGRLQPGTTKLAPAVRVVPLGDAIPAIPLDVINAFLNKNRVLDKEQMDAAPYVMTGQQERLIVATGDKLYARGPVDGDIPNYNIYRLGTPFTDPKTEELLGYEATDIGTVQVNALHGEVSTVTVTRSTEEVRIGDRMMPDEERAIDSTFFPSSPANENIEGLIVALDEGRSKGGKMNVAIINLGEREGIESGDVLAIYKEGKLINDRIGGDQVLLPEEKTGLLMVFRTFEKLSYALILESDQPIQPKDKLYSPARPM